MVGVLLWHCVCACVCENMALAAVVTPRYRIAIPEIRVVPFLQWFYGLNKYY